MEINSYREFASLSEKGRWNVETDIEWDKIDVSLALIQPDLLQQLRDSALIESYHPMSTLSTIQLCWDDVDATSILQVEQFEGFRHFWVLRRYLDAVNFQPPITDEEVIGHRARNLDTVKYDPADKTQVLINFTWSEHFAGYFFLRVAEKAKEPVLSKLAKLIAGDEFRHAEGGFRILQNLVTSDPSSVRAIIAAANKFRHYGNDVVDVPVSLENDLEAILKVVKRTQKICKVPLSEFSLEAYA